MAGAPLTAAFENVPESHDGQTAFTLELTFSESRDLSFRTLMFHAFTVDDGTVKRAKRFEKGSNIRWNITVAPDSDAEVTVTLPETTDCADSWAVCVGDGRKLSAPIYGHHSGPGAELSRHRDSDHQRHGAGWGDSQRRHVGDRRPQTA